jgi:hypothetical protein
MTCLDPLLGEVKAWRLIYREWLRLAGFELVAVLATLLTRGISRSLCSEDGALALRDSVGADTTDFN